MRITQNRKKLVLLLAIVVLFTTMPLQWEVFAANKSTNLGTATLQILSTSDLHGKSRKYSYDTGLESNGSLAQIATLVEEKKASLTNGATLLVDSGDTIFGYGTKAIYDGVVTGDEYMFHLMKNMGYDALTIGNHDFEYGHDYILNALEHSGIKSKTVLSNVIDAKTKKTILNESLIVTKKMTTNKGNKVSVKIGIIGVVIPSVINVTQYTGVLEVNDILQTVEEEVETLSEKTDLIVVLAHSGVGSQAPSEWSDNMVYAISELDDVDVICAGHNHVNYPAQDSPYYQYEGVDPDTGLMNGTVVVEETDHGRALGVSQLKLKFVNGKVKITKKQASIQEVTNDVEESQKIIDQDAAYAQQYAALYAKSIAKLKEAQNENGYFGPIEDNVLIQAANEAKIRYGMQAIEVEEPKYASYPIISATTYEAGGKTGKDYLAAQGDVTVEDCLNIQEYGHNMAVIYEIKGKELREALEWEAARLFQTAGVTQGAWNNSLIAEYAALGNTPLLEPESMDDWSGYGVYDGIEYEIDTSVLPRYNKAGQLINDTHRIVSLTLSGRAILDDETLMLVASKRYMTSNPLYGSTFADERKLIKNGSYVETYIENYFADLSSQGELNIQTDDNFRIRFDANSNYLVKSSEESQAYALTRDWYLSTLGTANGYAYYMAHFTDHADTSGPLLVLASMNEAETNKPITIKVQFSDRSGVASIQYLKGVYTADASNWNRANKIENRKFEVTENGTYSVLATDNAGNSTIKYITISNFNAGALEVPKVNAITNKKTSVTGTAEPGATVEVQINGTTYSAVADNSGKFTCETGYQNADQTAVIWQSLNGKRSSNYITTVLRRGGNLPVIDRYTNTMMKLTGFLNDNQYTYPVAICGTSVYVPSDRKSYYLASDFYLNHEDKTIEYCNYSYNASSQKFTLSIPVRNANQNVSVYVLDWIGRNSAVTKFQVEEVAPNMPTLYSVYAEEGTVYGQIPNVVSGQSYRVYAEAGNNGTLYSAVADGAGYFAIEMGSMKAGTTVKVAAEDEVNSVERESAVCESAIASAQYYQSDYSDAKLETITNKSTEISGNLNLVKMGYTSEFAVKLATENDSYKITPDEDGDFSVDLDEELSAGSNVYLFIRDANYHLYEVEKVTVALEKPVKPEIITDEIRAKTTKKVKVYCDDQAIAVVKVGSQYYEVSDCKYKSSYGGYIYTIKINPQELKAKQVFSVYMKNDAGKSKTVKMKVKKSLKPKKNTK